MINKERYIRQTTFSEFGMEGQEKIASGKVCIIGAGAVGTHLAAYLARAGVGYIKVADRNTVSLKHLQRQALYDEADAKQEKPKAHAVADHLNGINSEIVCEPVICDVNASNIEELIKNADLVLDGTDNYQTRFLINEACCKHGKPWIYASTIGAVASVMCFTWEEDMPCLNCLMPERPVTGTYDTVTTAGSIGMAAAAAASFSAAWTLKILAGKRTENEFYVFSLWNDLFKKGPIQKDEECPVCGKRHFQMLDSEIRDYSGSICGQDSWQILPSSGDGSDERKIDLKGLGEQLGNIGDVRITKFFLRFVGDDVSFKVFPDGRAIIENVKDEEAARRVYTEYIG